MDDYIKREDAKDAVINIVGWEKIAKYVDEMSKHFSTKDNEYYDALMDAEDVIDDLPPADVVPMERYKSMENTCVKLQKSLADVAPVVRCKDCRHAIDYYHEGDCYCSNPKWGLNYFGGSWEFYCADAERRNNE